MRLLELHIKAFGPFTDQVLSLGCGQQRLVLVHGMNEAGKSSALRAIAGLRFGIPARSTDRFLHEYGQMRIGGVFVDAQGQHYSLIRRKGTGVTLKFADFGQDGAERAEAVPAAVERLLTAGLSVDDYQSMFGLDHASLRSGGMALARGEGEIGAALFEASSGVFDVTRVLEEIDASAKQFYLPGGNAKNARINLALSEFKSQTEEHKQALVKPARWEAVAATSQKANEALQALEREHKDCTDAQWDIRELIAVAPILSSLNHAHALLQELLAQPLLAEEAALDRAQAEAGLAQSVADAVLHQAELAQHERLIAEQKPDPAILGLAPMVTRLHASIPGIEQLRAKLIAAQNDIDSRTLAWDTIAGQIDADSSTALLLGSRPTPAGKAQIMGCMEALEEAERALAQHRLTHPGQAGVAGPALDAIPDANLQAAVRVALSEVTQNTSALQRLAQLPGEIKAAERLAKSLLATSGLADEAAARAVTPVPGSLIDEASHHVAVLANDRAQRLVRIGEMQQAVSQSQDAMSGLLAHGDVPTHAQLRQARAHRQTGWRLVKAKYLQGEAVETASFTQGRVLAQVYEEAVANADAVVDSLALDSERVSRVESTQRDIDALLRDLKLRNDELLAIEAQQKQLESDWRKTLAGAGIAAMPVARLRDWQSQLDQTVRAFEALHSKRDEQQQLLDLQKALADKLRTAIGRLGVSKVDEADTLNALVAVAGDDLQQVQARVAASISAAGQTQQLKIQLDRYRATDLEMHERVQTCRANFAHQMGKLLLQDDASVAMARARLAQWDAFSAARDALLEAKERHNALSGALSQYRETACSIAVALAQPQAQDTVLAAELWAARLEQAQQTQERLGIANRALESARQALSLTSAKAARHRSTLERLCQAAGVAASTDLPLAEERSHRKRQAMRDANAATDQLAQASKRTVPQLQERLNGRAHDALQAESARIDQALTAVRQRLEQARAEDEAARRELDSISASDAGALAADAMARSLATVRNAMPLYMRSRLAHVLLKESVERFKERSQAPMLKSASGFFTQITGGEFDGLFNDDSQAKPVIAARRPNAQKVSVEAMSEGTQDQLYLALRLAALKLQRDRGVDLPVVLDDVLMASDDHRASCIFKALADFSVGGQVIVLTHHQHLCEVARQSVQGHQLAVVELKRR
jgi:uncharacterized protein YhaN